MRACRTSLLISALLVEPYFALDNDRYGGVADWQVFSSLLGFVLLTWPWFYKLEQNRPVSFFLYPKRWTIHFLKAFLFMGIIVVGIFAIEAISEKFASEWVVYQIGNDDALVIGKVVAYTKIKRSGRYRPYFQHLAIVQYVIDGKAYHLKQEMNTENQFSLGKTFRIKYAVQQPEIALVLD
ncbi:MAG: hypothetical protein AAGJ82_04375 [Bacteroidota bacterium]